MRMAISQQQAVVIPAGPVFLEGDLNIPDHARGVVVFAHGSGSSRHSPRNRFVAHELQDGGIATLLMDLLTADEERADETSGIFRFDIGLLARRLVAATQWLAKEQGTATLRVGYFGASTGGGAALVAAASLPQSIAAVVSRGGRPDLAGDSLPGVRAPTLLIVGGDDPAVIEMNQEAMDRLQCIKELQIVPGATHLFQEPGKLEEVAHLARDWFMRHLPAA